jgi:chromosome partitioning protein
VPLVVAFVSQKGGVGKSTLARGLGTFAVNKGLKTTIADLDKQQQTTIVWETTRARHDLKPLMDVRSFRSVADAVSSAKTSDLLILDMAGKITDGATEASAHAHLLVHAVWVMSVALRPSWQLREICHNDWQRLS